MEDSFAKDAADLERRLTVKHQQFNTEYMYRLDAITRRHEQEIIILAGVVVALICALSYDDYRIRRLDGHTHKESLTYHKG